MPLGGLPCQWRGASIRLADAWAGDSGLGRGTRGILNVWKKAFHNCSHVALLIACAQGEYN